MSRSIRFEKALTGAPSPDLRMATSRIGGQYCAISNTTLLVLRTFARVQKLREIRANVFVGQSRRLNVLKNDALIHTFV